MSEQETDAPEMGAAETAGANGNSGANGDLGESATGESQASSLYWKANLRLLGILMVIWFVVSFGAGILFRDWLDQFMIGGYPLGFWFAQQGAIYVFMGLIFYYSFAMRRLERKYDLED